MYYDYPEEEFYVESEYENQIEALKEAVRNSVKSEILEEMNRLREENEKLQDVKENYEQIKLDYERKKDECDRIIFNAERNAAEKRFTELMENHKLVKWKIGWIYVYGPKCGICKEDRTIEFRLPSGKMVADNCKCQTESKKYYYPEERVLVSIEEKGSKIAAYYEQKRGDGFKYDLYTMGICDRYSAEKKKEIIENLDGKVMQVLFDNQEECQEVCNKLNADLGNFMYLKDGTDIKEYLKKKG